MDAINTESTPPEDFSDVDATLISEAQKNPEAFRGIYERWEVPVYQYFYYRTHHKPSAEDLTSQLFLAVLQSIGRYKHSGHFAAWLFTIARNLAAKYYRQNRREDSFETFSKYTDASDPIEELALSEEIERLQLLVASLSRKEQELIRLRYAAGLKFSDIALILHKREDAVKKTLYRLQTRLQHQLEQNDD